MFLLFGFGKQTIKRYGKTPELSCGHCRNTTSRHFIRMTQWFTLFFIPIIPYSIKYLLVCPVCNDARQIEREEMDEIIRNLSPLETKDIVDAAWTGDVDDEPGAGTRWSSEKFEKMLNQSDAGKYAGKNPTQKAYLEKLEAHERALEAREEEG